MKPSFGKRLTASYFFVVAITLVITGWLLTPRLKQGFLSQLEQSLSVQTKLVAQDVVTILREPPAPAVINDKIRQFANVTGCRVTLIRADGVVIGDSERSLEELTKMDNHLHRPEVDAALNQGRGESSRFSATLHEDMLYMATPVSSDEGRPLGVLRLALPLTEVNHRIASFQKDLLKAGAVAMLAAFGVALISVRKISQPLRALVTLSGHIGSGQVPEATNIDSRDEFGRLARAFQEMANRIEEKVSELTRERTQLGAMLSSLVEGIVALDHQGRVLFLNPAAEQLFDVRSSDARDRPFLEVLRQSPLNEVLTQTLSTHRTIQKEIALHTPSDRIISVNAIPVSYGEAQTGVLAALHDITELRKLENVRREFVANVTHELKTPLTSIKGYAETLLEGALADPKHNRTFVETIHEHANNLASLIDDVLDLSTIEAQRVMYRFEAVDFREVTERIIKALEPMAKTRKVSLLIDLPQDLPKVRADREKLAQIVMNLIDNAIKFNKATGEVRITGEKKDGQAHFAVSDTGRGISAEDLPRVFERFYRGNKDRSHEIPGTGLGLAIVKHLIEAHQGTVTAQSIPGQGAVFRFTLPLA
jgi:two-component system phosphate regulon sensor histidine kinase PhoR